MYQQSDCIHYVVTSNISNKEWHNSRTKHYFANPPNVTIIIEAYLSSHSSLHTDTHTHYTCRSIPRLCACTKAQHYSYCSAYIYLQNICNVKLLGLARGNTKKQRNKKADENITPIRYNIIHMHVQLYSVEVAASQLT